MTAALPALLTKHAADPALVRARAPPLHRGGSDRSLARPPAAPSLTLSRPTTRCTATR